jgi:hypothetical protein
MSKTCISSFFESEINSFSIYGHGVKNCQTMIPSPVIYKCNSPLDIPAHSFQYGNAIFLLCESLETEHSCMK